MDIERIVFTHFFVEGHGWEDTIFLPTDFYRVMKMPFLDRDGGILFMAYDDMMKPYQFKGYFKSNEDEKQTTH